MESFVTDANVLPHLTWLFDARFVERRWISKSNESGLNVHVTTHVITAPACLHLHFRLLRTLEHFDQSCVHLPSNTSHFNRLLRDDVSCIFVTPIYIPFGKH
jgi:hypothetical protein